MLNANTLGPGEPCVGGHAATVDGAPGQAGAGEQMVDVVQLKPQLSIIAT
jgi:hypothetical protein